MNVLSPADVSVRAGGVIWITGYSAAGKTTVGRKVEARLRELGLPTIFLDGDDLRSIFSARWGYEREDRVELARIYFRLCSHLSSQGHTVVIAAVAMYDEVRQWLKSNVPQVLDVFLNVPEEERLRRDDSTKKVYAKMGKLEDLYDAPDAFSLKIDNFGSVSPDFVAEQVLQKFLTIDDESADFGRNEHWGSYYSKASVPAQPSPFAREVADKVSASARLLEIGCGNGRDSVYFDSLGHSVVAVDASDAAIERCKQTHAATGAEFHHGTLPEVAPKLHPDFDIAYSRFVLHAMPVSEEVELLECAFALLKDGGELHVECRSINDPMARMGEVISPTERIHGHYRRFIVQDELVERLKHAGFEVRDLIESDGLAVHGDENPVVIRVVAVKLPK